MISDLNDFRYWYLILYFPQRQLYPEVSVLPLLRFYIQRFYIQRSNMKTHICANITNYCRSQTLFYWSITDASAEVRFTLPVDYSTCKLSVYILRYMYDTRYGADKIKKHHIVLTFYIVQINLKNTILLQYCFMGKICIVFHV